jgi:hypothetical protein
VNELFPLLCGLIVGTGLALVAPRLRPILGALAAILLGVAATVVSGEYHIGWEFVLIDIPLVALSSVVALVAVRAARHTVHRRSPHG